MPIALETVRGRALQPFLQDLASLRIRIFRSYPYLYDGDFAYEKSYLETYLRCPDSLAALALDGAGLVGATTALPLGDAEDEFKSPFRQAGMPVEKIFYFGESVLLPKYRGQGIGHRFFEIREEAARSWGAALSSFCAVDRPADHPARPDSYRPLDSFWSSKGYRKCPDLKAEFAWREVGHPEETNHTLTFWTKPL